MNKHFILASFLFLFFQVAHANNDTQAASEKLIAEYGHLRDAVSRLQPDNNPDDGPYYLQKNYGDYIIMWKLEKEEKDSNYREVIRFYFKPKEHHPSFAVTYHKTTEIEPGMLVLRKFVGPEPMGWRNDTINYQTGEYLGSQGRRQLSLPEYIKTTLTQWGIEPFLFF